MTGYNDGLCSTCRHSSACTYMKEASSAVHFCEEYETGNSPAKTGRKRAFSKDDPLKLFSREIGKQSFGRILGLCSDCVHRKECLFPKPESGVWHCEEYR